MNRETLIDQDHGQRRRRYVVIVWLLAVVVVVLGMWISVTWLSPTPPRAVTMAVDSESSTPELAARYRGILVRDGIELRLVSTAGAVESVARLNDARSGVSIAIVPSGITNAHDSPGLVSLGTLFYEPLWFFYRGREPIRSREALRGMTISIGAEGSGTRLLSLEFLARAGVIEQQFANFVALAPQEATGKLRRGEINAAVMLAPWASPLVHELLAADDIRLIHFNRAEAWVALYPYLSELVLPAGVGDMAKDRPPANVMLVAPKASLVVRDDLHPAIQYLLLRAAGELHSSPELFRKAGQFPAPESLDLPLSEHAVQYYKSGRPFLQRYLPFRLAVLAQQLLVLLIPVLGVIYPLLRFVPAIYGWAMRHRVFSLYGELRFLEQELDSADAKTNPADLLERLNRLEERASRFRVPVAFRPLLYTLRLHITLVRQRIGSLSTQLNR
jgi:TRAP-type uncharacterized transport system substrate-binding protein